MTAPIRIVILGELASKANQRQIVLRGGKPMSIKSEKARAYEASAMRQIPPKCRQRLEGLVRFTARIYYASERPDLDESVLLDVLQDHHTIVRTPAAGGGFAEVRQLVQAGVYRNDRQVRERHVFHAIDKVMPRAEIEIEPIDQATTEGVRWTFNLAHGWTAEGAAVYVKQEGLL